MEISTSRFWLHCYNIDLAIPQAFKMPFVAKSGLVILWISLCIQPEHCSNFPQKPHLPRKENPQPLLSMTSCHCPGLPIPISSFPLSRTPLSKKPVSTPTHRDIRICKKKHFSPKPTPHIDQYYIPTLCFAYARALESQSDTRFEPNSSKHFRCRGGYIRGLADPGSLGARMETDLGITALFTLHFLYSDIYGRFLARGMMVQ